MWIASVIGVVPAVRDGPTDGQLIAELIEGPHAGMGEWLAILIGVRNHGEEVVRGTDRVVTDRRDETTGSHGPVVVSAFRIQIGDGEAVERAVGAPLGFEPGGGVPAIVGAIEGIDSHAPVGAAAFGLRHAAEAVPEFVHLVVVRTVGPRHRAVETVGGAIWIPGKALFEPAGRGPLTVFAARLAQLRGFAQIREQTTA